LQQLQKERRQQQAAKAKQTRQSAQPQSRANGHPEPDAAEDHAAFSDPAATDSR